MIKGEMVGWHHQLNGHELEREAWCAAVHGGHKESDMTERLNKRVTLLVVSGEVSS